MPGSSVIGVSHFDGPMRRPTVNIELREETVEWKMSRKAAQELADAVEQSIMR